MSQATPIRPYVRHETEGDALWFLGSLATVKTAGAQTRERLTVMEIINPAGFAPPLHRHLEDDECFYVLSGTARFLCDGNTFDAGPGDFLDLPVGLPHSFVVGPDEPLRSLVITTPSGFEHFVAEIGEPAAEHRLPDPVPFDPAALSQIAARHGIEILGPPPNT